ncbi:MAG: NAD(P)H-dependent oxidoreductase [Burkholderia sp.]
MKLLHIDSSVTGAHSVSRELSRLIVDTLAAAGPLDIRYRDLVAEDLPHFTAATAPTAHQLSQAAPATDAAQQAARATSDAILKEFIEADVIVLGVPMYNFTVPSQLKAWLDRIVVPGTTFRRGANGIEGLAGDKRVLLAIARGGVYDEASAARSVEHGESLLRALLGFLGVSRIESVVAEGLIVAETKDATIAAAREAARRIAA